MGPPQTVSHFRLPWQSLVASLAAHTFGTSAPLLLVTCQMWPDTSLNFGQTFADSVVFIKLTF
jgi:hypothetical protein